MSQLLDLPEEQAVRAFFDARNCRVLFRLLLLFALAALVVAVSMAALERYSGLVVPALNLILIRLLYTFRERDVFTRAFSIFLLSFLVIQPLLWKAMFFDQASVIHPADFLGPAFLLFFRLPADQMAVPLGTIWALSVGRNFVEAALTPSELYYGFILSQTITTFLVYSIVVSATRKERSAFLIEWRRELHRHREERRMQEELDSARKIQLSMLPHNEPDISWLETAGISIPASEVGGDYYDYFKLSETRWVVVVGDVAGHGVASGLLLSAVRSCLYLLHESPLDPAQILTKIDRMLQQTSARRNFVTLVYALFDYEARTLTFSMAGHPPILCVRSGGDSIEELALHSLPLGTRIGSHPRQHTVAFAENDIFIFFTDGIAETVNTRGDIYGDSRMLQKLGEISHGRSAREIRDTILGDVWLFKGDGLQLDDITVVVSKVR